MVFESGLQYGWKTGSCVKADAQKTGELCERLSATEGLSPQTLLDANRAEGSLLHDEFEWDDGIAAEKYRLEQSAHIIRSIVIVKRDEGEQKEAEETEQSRYVPVRAWFPVGTAPGRYESIAVIAKDDELRRRLLDDCLKDLRAFQRKYASLREVVRSVEASISMIERYIKELEEKNA